MLFYVSIIFIYWVYFDFILWLCEGKNSEFGEEVEQIIDEIYPDCFEDEEQTHEIKTACGDAMVYCSISDTSVIYFNLNSELLDLQRTCKSISLDELDEFSRVRYLDWPSDPAKNPSFCDDVVADLPEMRKWNLSSGEITAAVSLTHAERGYDMYLISILLLNAVFDRSEDGLEPIIIDKLVVRDALVGWYPG